MSEVSEYLIDGLGIVQSAAGFRLLDGRQFQAGWLLGADEESLIAIGAVPVTRDEMPAFDPRIERLVETLTGAHISYAVVDIETEIIDAAMLTHQRQAEQSIDSAAEQARCRFITPGSGQAMVYQDKTAEAARWLANGNPVDLSAYPFINAEVGITAANPAALVAMWISMANSWRLVAAQIEAARMAGKVAILGAADFQQVDDAKQTAIDLLGTIQPPE